MDVVLLLLAIYAAITAVITEAVLWAFRRVNKRPRYLTVFICCLLGFFLLITLVDGFAMLLRQS
jgi:chromate transport protein ChrA